MPDMTPEQYQAYVAQHQAAMAAAAQQAPPSFNGQPAPPPGFGQQPQPQYPGYPPMYPQAPQQPKTIMGINPTVLFVVVALIVGFLGYNYINKDKDNKPDNPDDEPVAGKLADKIDKIFKGAAKEDKLFLGQTMEAVAERLEADAAKQPASWVKMGEIRGPLAGEVSRFLYRPRLAKVLDRDEAKALGELLATEIERGLTDVKDSDSISSANLKTIVENLHNIAHAAGYKH